MILSGAYDTVKKSLSVTDCECLHTENDELSVYVLTDSTDDISGLILSEYSRLGAGCASVIPETFIAVIYDKKQQTLFAFSDITTSPLDLYYTVNDSKLYFSTSLKKLLKSSGCERKLSISSAKEFLTNGFVFGAPTLIENVYKIASGYMLVACADDISQINYEYKTPEYKGSDAEEELLPVMRENVKKLIDEDGDIFIPLSSGFDSNLVLDTVLACVDKEINAFTVGGKTGRSEIETVKENVADIKQVKLHTVTVDETYFDKFSDIVWRLDGCVFEVGVFLQYALASALSESGAKNLICGEYADQILSCFYNDSLKRATGGKVKKNEKFFMYADPYVTGNMIILKKSAKMLDSFGITGRYPFARNNIAPVAGKIRNKNGTSKKLYKEKCREVFRPNIVKNLQKIGGSTSNQAILSQEGYEKLREILNSNQLLKKINSEGGETVVSARSYKLRLRQAFEWLYGDIKECGVAGGLKKTKSTLQSKGMSKELKELYLLIFNELFIGDSFDKAADSESAVYTTSEILRKL